MRTATDLPVLVLALLVAAAGLARGQQNQAGIVAQLILKEDGGRVEVIRNPQARTLEVITRGMSGEIARRDVFRLNAAGDPVGCTTFDGAGNLIFRVKYAFDKMGRKVAEGTYNRTGKMVRRVTYGYDTNGKQLAPRVENFADAERQPVAPIAPELTPSGRLAQPPPGKR